MQVYGVNDFGLYVRAGDLAGYAQRSGLTVGEVAVEAGMVEYLDAEGEAIPLGFKGYPFGVGACFYLAELSRYPSLFATAYASTDEAVLELRLAYGKYLPANFDFEGNFVNFVGTTWG